MSTTVSNLSVSGYRLLTRTAYLATKASLLQQSTFRVVDTQYYCITAKREIMSMSTFCHECTIHRANSDEKMFQSLFHQELSNELLSPLSDLFSIIPEILFLLAQNFQKL
jgi:hypothetical protein